MYQRYTIVRPKLLPQSYVSLLHQSSFFFSAVFVDPSPLLRGIYVLKHHRNHQHHTNEKDSSSYKYNIDLFCFHRTMIFRSALVLALTCLPASQGFTTLTPSRSVTSTSQLFDMETSSVWAADLAPAQSLNTQMDSFSPSEADLMDAEALLSKKSSSAKSDFINSKASIESEFPQKRKIRASVRETGTDSMKSYIKTMCNHELLNKNEEIILAREIQILLKWEGQREELESQLLR